MTTIAEFAVQSDVMRFLGICLALGIAALLIGTFPRGRRSK